MSAADLNLLDIAKHLEIRKNYVRTYDETPRAIRIKYDPAADTDETGAAAATVAYADDGADLDITFELDAAADTRIQYGATPGDIVCGADEFTLKSLVDYINVNHNQHGWFAELQDMPGGASVNDDGVCCLGELVAADCYGVWAYNGLCIDLGDAAAGQFLGVRGPALYGIHWEIEGFDQQTLQGEDATNFDLGLFVVEGDTAQAFANPAYSYTPLADIDAPAAAVVLLGDNAIDYRATGPNRELSIFVKDNGDTGGTKSGPTAGQCAFKVKGYKTGMSDPDRFTSGQNPSETSAS